MRTYIEHILGRGLAKYAAIAMVTLMLAAVLSLGMAKSASAYYVGWVYGPDGSTCWSDSSPYGGWYPCYYHDRYSGQWYGPYWWSNYYGWYGPQGAVSGTIWGDCPTWSAYCNIVLGR